MKRVLPPLFKNYDNVSFGKQPVAYHIKLIILLRFRTALMNRIIEYYVFRGNKKDSLYIKIQYAIIHISQQKKLAI